MIGLIGGTGVGEIAFDAGSETRTIATVWGDVSTRFGALSGCPVVFLARHGAGHAIPPHRINYRANIAALRQLGALAVIATTAVGAIRPLLAPGDIVIPDDLIDFTLQRRNKTFFDGQDGVPVVHTEISRPYSEPVRAALLEAAVAVGVAARPGGVYLCADGPRYETAAEVRLFAQWGADLVGMTGVPETTLAREAGLHYAAVSLVTNLGAGLSPIAPSHTDVEIAMRKAMPGLHAVLGDAVQRLSNVTLPPIGPGIQLPTLHAIDSDLF
jgi:5'-methylthioadenosine phosphorylase